MKENEEICELAEEKRLEMLKQEMNDQIEMNQKAEENRTDSFKKKITIKDILLLQGVIIIYTLSSVTAKYASEQELFSFAFFVFYGLEVMILGIYAIAWQQIIKKFDLSVAYANRAMAILWSAVWAILLFHNHLTLKNAAGIVLVMIGTIVINSDQQRNFDDRGSENKALDIRDIENKALDIRDIENKALDRREES